MPAFDQDRMWGNFRRLMIEQAEKSAKTRSGQRLTAPRPEMAQAPARVAPMSESENMRNITKVSAEILAFPNSRARADDGAFLALASMTLSRKSSRRALARCEKRVTRAVDRIRRAALPETDAAVAALARACSSCGKCAGVGI